MLDLHPVLKILVKAGGGPGLASLGFVTLGKFLHISEPVSSPLPEEAGLLPNSRILCTVWEENLNSDPSFHPAMLDTSPKPPEKREPQLGERAVFIS